MGENPSAGGWGSKLIFRVSDKFHKLQGNLPFVVPKQSDGKVKKIIMWLVVGQVALLVLIQLVPYGRNHTNPPVVQEPQWDSQQTRKLAKRA